jgi:hypothetical protein
MSLALTLSVSCAGRCRAHNLAALSLHLITPSQGHAFIIKLLCANMECVSWLMIHDHLTELRAFLDEKINCCPLLEFNAWIFKPLVYRSCDHTHPTPSTPLLQYYIHACIRPVSLPFVKNWLQCLESQESALTTPGFNCNHITTLTWRMFQVPLHTNLTNQFCACTEVYQHVCAP